MDTIEPIHIGGVRVTLAQVGNHYRYRFTIDAVTHKGTAPSRDGAIALAHDRISRCKKERDIVAPIHK